MTGKPSGLDLREHKVTLPLIHALGRIEGAERADVEAFFRDPEPSDEAIHEVIELVTRHGGLDYARERRCRRRSVRTARWRAFPKVPRSTRCATASCTRWSGVSSGTAFAAGAAAMDGATGGDQTDFTGWGE